MSNPRLWLVTLLATLPLAAQQPTLDFGDLPDSFGTLAASNGPRHTPNPNLFLGTVVADAELDASANDTATGDGADEEVSAYAITAGQPDPNNPGNILTQIDFAIRNTTGGPVQLSVFADFSRNGQLQLIQRPTVQNNTNGFSLIYSLPPSFYPPSGDLLVPFRLRLSTTTGLASTGPSTGPFPDGEVEDHFFNFGPRSSDSGLGGDDYGDFPDTVAGARPGEFGTANPPDYHTRRDNTGPYHRITPGLSFNDTSSPDGEFGETANQNPTATADAAGPVDDESGLLTAITDFTVTPISSSPLMIRANVTVLASLPVENTTGTTAFASAWVDFDQSGEFAFGEQLDLAPNDVLSRYATIPGDGSQTEIRFTIPYTFIVNDACQIDGDYYLPLRVRLTTFANIGPRFPAPNGEVEDHLIRLRLMSSDFCATDDRDFLRTVTGNALAGADLTLAPGDFLPATYAGQASPVWYLGRQNLGTNPTLTAVQIAAIQNGTQTLFFQRPDGSAGIAPKLEIIESPDLLSYLSGQGLSGANFAPYLDPDGDGWSNLAEYALASDASDPASGPVVSVEMQPDPTTSADHLGLLYPKRLGTSLVSYEVQGSTTLGSWGSPIEPAAIPVGLPAPPAGYQWAFDRFSLPQSSLDDAFLRLKVE